MQALGMLVRLDELVAHTHASQYNEFLTTCTTYACQPNTSCSVLEVFSYAMLSNRPRLITRACNLKRASTPRIEDISERPKGSPRLGPS